MKRTSIAVAALSALAIAIPAGATTGDTTTAEPTATATETPTETSTEPTWVPNKPLTDVYFLCDGETKEGTVNAQANSQYPSWSETKPAGSITGGEGCGQVDEFVLSGIRPSTPFEFTAVGYYTGNLDKLSFAMHNIFVGPGRRSNAITADVRVLVDGTSLFGLESTTNAAQQVSTEPAAKRIILPVKGTGATGAAALLEGTVGNIDMLAPADNLEHEIVFNITSAEPLNVWAWGNTEAPSGLTFNPAEPSGVAVQAVPKANR